MTPKLLSSLQPKILAEGARLCFCHLNDVRKPESLVILLLCNLL